MEFPSPDKPRLPHEIKCISPREVSSNIVELNRITGSLVGLAVGDALGASVEFRPHQYFVDHPVHDMEGGGTWGLNAGQWTDDTSMALCLASSLIDKKGFDPYDQMVRYKWWYKHGYMSSTGRCFDIGNATRESLEKFAQRQKILQSHFNSYDEDKIDNLSWNEVQSVKEFEINCSSSGVAGNGALMRLAPVPLFFYQSPTEAVEYAGRSARFTHGDKKAVDACRYYAALIVAAVRGERKSDLLQKNFYDTHRAWFGTTDIHGDILRVAHGSYQRPKGYEDGIRGKGYIVNALEAALWALWSDNDSFEQGALAAVNLGDDTDTTAAIYGQLAGAVYGYQKLPQKWLKTLYAHELLVCIGKWLYFEGNKYNPRKEGQKTISLGQTPNIALSDYDKQSRIQGSTAKLSNTSPTRRLESDSNQLRTDRPYAQELPSYHQHSSIHGPPVHPSHISPTQMNQSDSGKLSTGRWNTRDLSKYPQDFSRTQKHQSNKILVSSPRSGPYYLSDHNMDVNQLSTHQQYAKQSSAYYPDDYQSPDHYSNDNQIRRHRQYVEQSSPYRPAGHQLSGYQSGFSQSQTNQADLQHLSASRRGAYKESRSQPGLSQSWMPQSEYQQISARRSNGDRPSMYRMGHASDNQDIDRYSYGIYRNEVCSPSNKSLLASEDNRRSITKPNILRYDVNGQSDFLIGNTLSPSSYNYPSTLHRQDQTYYNKPYGTSFYEYHDY